MERVGAGSRVTVRVAHLPSAAAGVSSAGQHGLEVSPKFQNHPLQQNLKHYKWHNSIDERFQSCFKHLSQGFAHQCDE